MTRDNDGEAHSTGAYPCKILVVDDEPDLERLVLQRMRREIRRRQYAFEFAHNGVEALELLSQDRGIDIVLSDINTCLKWTALRSWRRSRASIPISVP